MSGMDYYKVTGYSIDEHASTMSRRKDYEFLVGFKSRGDNKETHENFLKWYRNWDGARDGRPYHLFSDEVCAVALAVFYLRQSMKRLEDAAPTRDYSPNVPTTPPAAQDAGHKLWVLKEVATDVYVEANAGWDLYMQCQYRKVPVGEAKSFLQAKFERKPYVWERVLTHFRKNGGRYTDLYLRVDR